MSYEKLGFTSGQTLKAEHLNHMEDGIANPSWYDIKDKPFGEVETVVNEPLNITWDGNPDGLDELVYAESGGHYFFKVSSHVFTDEQIKLATINAHFPDAPVPIGEAWNNMLKKGYVTEGAVYAFYAVFVRKAGAEVNGAVFPEAGVYAAFNNGYYTYSITTTEPIEQTKTVVKKIDEKYLPEVGGSNITYFYGESQYLYWDEDLTMPVSRTEFLTAYQKGEVRIITSSVGFISNPISVNIANEYARVQVADTSKVYVGIIEFNTSEYVEAAPPV